MEDKKKETIIKKEIIEPASLEVTENIIKQMKNSVCKIYNKRKKGTGFFAKIPYNNDLLTVLITNNNILGEDEITNNKTISFSLNNNDNDKKNIELSDERKRYTNEVLDITIIEIDENKDDIHDYIELDDEILDSMELNKPKIIKKLKDKYMNKSIYLLNYLNGEDIVVSYGLLTEINEGNGIKHNCNADRGSSGSPILSLENNKLIGIHFKSNEKNDNKGTLIIYALQEFQNIDHNLLIKKDEISDSDEITLQYNIKNKEKIKLFGNQFIERNKKRCKIIIDNKEQDIIEFYDIDKKDKKDILEIKFKKIKSITNFSHMFGDQQYNSCHTLTSITDISKWDMKNVTNMSYMFCGCSSLKSIPEISSWDTSNVTNMSYMFCGCSSISSFSDISKWDTSNVTNMSHMFNGCSSLTSLPDISKWNTNNVTNMSYMFNNCSSLPTLPDISQWDMSNVTNISYMFNYCSSLSKLPDISKWNIKNVKNMSFMFNCCRALSSLPDISKWDITNVKNMSFMFDNCKSLSSFKIPPKFK